MKRIKKIVLLLLVTLTINLPVIARDNFSVDLIETNKDLYYVGETIDYSLDINLKKDPEEFRSINITFDLSDGLDFKSVGLEGKGLDEDSMKVNVTNGTGKVRFINLEFNDTSKLKGLREFTVHIKSEVNDNKQEGQPLTNRFIAYYQMKDGSTGSYQNDFKSEGVVTYKKARSETLKMYMANIYTDFMDDIQGIVEPGHKLKVSFGTYSTEPIVSKDGFFSFNVPAGTDESIFIELFDAKGKQIDTKRLKYVDINGVTRRDVLSVREAMDNVGKTEKVEDLLTGIVIGDDNQTNYELLRKIYTETKEEKSQVYHHEAYMNGYPDGTFKPGSTITRAEISAILSRIISKDEIKDMKPEFKDVDQTKWYSKYVAHMVKEGLMEGYEDGSFKPTNPVTRAELATIIARLKNLSSQKAPYFKDLKRGYWALESINKVAAEGIMTGYPDGTFLPANKLTRGEAATIINRTLGRMPDEQTIKTKNIQPFKDIKNHWSYYHVVEAAYDHNSIFVDGKEIYE